MDESFFNSLRSDDYTLLIGRAAMVLLFLPSGIGKLARFHHLAIIGGLLFLHSSGAGAISWQGVRGWRRRHPRGYEPTHAM